jgi:hypothetical protein
VHLYDDLRLFSFYKNEVSLTNKLYPNKRTIDVLTIKDFYKKYAFANGSKIVELLMLIYCIRIVLFSIVKF